MKRKGKARGGDRLKGEKKGGEGRGMRFLGKWKRLEVYRAEWEGRKKGARVCVSVLGEGEVRGTQRRAKGELRGGERQ